MQITVNIHKSINYTIDLSEHKDVLNRRENALMGLRFKILGNSSSGHFELNPQFDSVSMRELLFSLVNGNNEELLKDPKLYKEHPFLEKLLQKSFKYFY